jgi:hypothetical protein
MPRYKLFCRSCKKLFSTLLSLVDYEAGEALWHSALRQQNMVQ